MTGDEAARLHKRARFWIICGTVFVLGVVSGVCWLINFEFSGWVHSTDFHCSDEHCDIREILVDGKKVKRSILFSGDFDVPPGMRDIEVRTNIGVVRKKMEIEDREIYCSADIASQVIFCTPY
jgi:hypothetical protein